MGRKRFVHNIPAPMHRKGAPRTNRSFLFDLANGGEPEFNCRAEAADQNLAIG